MTEKIALSLGSRVYWRYAPKGRSGSTLKVRGVITKMGLKKVQIRIVYQGEFSTRWVDPKNLSPRNDSDSQASE